MTWNWEHPSWPEFDWDETRLAAAERRFLVQGGVTVGALEHLESGDRARLTIDALTDEAMTTSEIEGELLDRASVQSSIGRHFGIEPTRKPAPKEAGIAEVMVDLFRDSSAPLDESTLFRWHEWIVAGRRDIVDVGRYRTGQEPMQVISGRVGEPRVHFEAPPSQRVPGEMEQFFGWLQRTGPSGSAPLPPVTRAGVAHLYFESIHPFEDGNGRLGRAISEKLLSIGFGRPTLTGLANSILIHRAEYYRRLERHSRRLVIDDWLAWFAGIVLEAQLRTHRMIEFVVEKTKLLDRVAAQLNERQLKVLLRVLREGPGGFEGGLSAGNYQSIARTSPATARRDLHGLVGLGALERTGERKHTRYHLAIRARPVPRVTIDADGTVVET